jgi:amino acid transporter
LTYWPGAADTNEAAWVTIFLVVIVAINLFGVRGYGEAEFVFAIIKVVAVIGFIILGIILNCGGGPHGGYIGGSYW